METNKTYNVLVYCCVCLFSVALFFANARNYSVQTILETVSNELAIILSKTLAIAIFRNVTNYVVRNVNNYKVPKC